MPVERVVWVEIDTDGCALDFGVGACPAALAGAVVRKCYRTWATCPTVATQAAYVPTVRTLRFVQPRAGLPRGGPLMIPALLSVSEVSATANIAGADDRMGGFGRRGTGKAVFRDFRYHDGATDLYAGQRRSGAAQIDEGPYEPNDRGTFFGRLRARWPYYTGRPFRRIEADLDGGVLTVRETRHFVITEMAGPDTDGKVTVEYSDVLDLADSDRVVAPKPTPGQLAADIDALAGALTLTPAGVGDAHYPATGRLCIGSEIVSFTRTGDAFTLTGRGLSSTTAAAHKAGDTAQLTFSVQNARIDDTLLTLLRDFGGIPADWFPVAEWAAEVSRWMPAVRLTTDVCTPTGVAKLAGELAVLGVTVWPDDVARKVRLRCNRPVFGDTVAQLDERRHILSIKAEDRNEARLTDVFFYSVQIDPTKSATSADNYRRAAHVWDERATSPRAHGDTRIRRVFCRWLNQGADAVVAGLARRLLNRFADAPRHLRIVARRDSAPALVAVADVTTRALQDVTGRSDPARVQIISQRAEAGSGNVELVAQAYDFSGRYGVATNNSRPTYSLSTQRQRANGFYAVNPATMTFPDGTGPYRAI